MNYQEAFSILKKR